MKVWIGYGNSCDKATLCAQVFHQSVICLLYNATDVLPGSQVQNLYGADYVTLQAFAGLTNSGNTCYINTILQCLVTIPELVATFVTPASGVGQDKSIVSEAFESLVQQMCTLSDIDLSTYR